MPNPAQAIKPIGDSIGLFLCNAMLLQGYANSVLEQPLVSFPKKANVIAFQNKVNASLRGVKVNVNYFLGNILPELTTLFGDIHNFFSLYLGLCTSIHHKGLEYNELIDSFSLFQSFATAYQSEVSSLNTNLGKLKRQFTVDEMMLHKSIVDFNHAINGDNGFLAEISGKMNNIDNKLSDEYPKNFIGGFAMGAGYWFMLLGTLGFEYSGISPMYLGAIIFFMGSAFDNLAVYAALDLIKKKYELLENESRLKAEVVLSLSITHGIQSMKKISSNLLSLLSKFAIFWNSLIAELSAIRQYLKNKTMSLEQARVTLLSSINIVEKIFIDLTKVKNIMSGVQVVQYRSIHEFFSKILKLSNSVTA